MAVPADTETPSYLKFSTDEGNCWHQYEFTNESFVFKRMLTEPGNTRMTVAIWGYGELDREWRTIVINFEHAIPHQCKHSDVIKVVVVVAAAVAVIAVAVAIAVVVIEAAAVVIFSL